MPSRDFRWEYVQDVVFEKGEVVHREEYPYDSGTATSPVMAIFRAKDDGKHYAFEYGYNREHGFYSTAGWSPDRIVSCREMKKEAITIEKWLSVPDAVVHRDSK